MTRSHFDEKCSSCGAEKPLEQFQVWKASKDGFVLFIMKSGTENMVKQKKNSI